MQPTQNQVTDTVTPDLNTVAQTLRDVSLYLQRHGWVQGEYYDATSGRFTPPACLVGAVGMVCYGGPVDAPAQNFDDPGFGAFEDAVVHLDGYLIHAYDLGVYDFNDARGRTVDEVLAALDAAAVSDPSMWLPACCGRRMVEDPAHSPHVVVYDRSVPHFEAERYYVCGICRSYRVELVHDADELSELFTGWRTEADAAVHEGDRHEPGTSDDCDACDRYCYCTTDRMCVRHADMIGDAYDYVDADADYADFWRSAGGGVR